MSKEFTVTISADTTEFRQALDACAAGIGICGASPWDMQFADEAHRIGDLMAKAMLLTGKTDTEIRALAAQSVLCFADFVAVLIDDTISEASPAVSSSSKEFQAMLDEQHQRLMEFCGLAINQPIIPPIAVPGVTGTANPSAPFPPPQLPPGATAHNPPPPPHFIKWGYYMVCPFCGYAESYCGCAKAPPPPPTQGDGDGSSLEARVRAARSGR